MADDFDELGLRLDRVEHALRRSPDSPSRTPAGPEIRSARSIVNRVDDVWVAVTEGNERVAAAIDGLRVELGRLAAAVRAPEQSQAEGDPAGVDGRLQRIEEALARMGETAEPDPAVHLRLNRVEEGLAGIAGRLEELVIAARSADETLAERLGRLRDQFRR